MTYETILVERDQRVGIITLNRPQALNALNSQVMNEVTSAATELDDDPDIGAIIITGSAKAFAAGADIKEMADLTFADAFTADFFATWGKLAAERVSRHREVRTARDKAGRAARHGRLPAADPGYRQG